MLLQKSHKVPPKIVPFHLRIDFPLKKYKNFSNAKRGSYLNPLYFVTFFSSNKSY